LLMRQTNHEPISSYHISQCVCPYSPDGLDYKSCKNLHDAFHVCFALEDKSKGLSIHNIHAPSENYNIV
jgi:hypothetical protein